MGLQKLRPPAEKADCVVLVLRTRRETAEACAKAAEHFMTFISRQVEKGVMPRAHQASVAKSCNAFDAPRCLLQARNRGDAAWCVVARKVRGRKQLVVARCHAWRGKTVHV